MSLYTDAAQVLEASLAGRGSLKSLTYSNNNNNKNNNNGTLKNKPAHIYALVSQAAKWAPVLKEVIERSESLGRERKLTPALALLLTHDLLLVKSGIAAPANHPLKLAVTKHQVRLRAELTRLRIRRGHATIDSLRACVEAEAITNPALESGGIAAAHPRWVRINTVKTTLPDQLATTFAQYKPVDDLATVLTALPTSKIYHLDQHVPLLLALPPRTDVTKTAAYANGELILQDKASCFPGVLLRDLEPSSDVVDGCAAPGNKTSQLGEIAYTIRQRSGDGETGPRVYAFERDPHRAKILHKMLGRAGLADSVTVKAGVDFLTSDPYSTELANVSALLLDPSCSGSGIVNRDGHLKLELPVLTDSQPGRPSSRKTRPPPPPKPTRPDGSEAEENETIDPDGTSDADSLAERLASLAGFQLKIVEHAMSFPAATRISYSTCSVHCEENEDVVLRALKSTIAKERGWRIWTRSTQPEGMKTWNRRGLPTWADGVRNRGEGGGGVDLDEIADSCIRCAKDSPNEGTMGFFLAGFVRDRTGGGTSDDVVVEDEEWEGFSDSS